MHIFNLARTCRLFCTNFSLLGAAVAGRIPGPRISKLRVLPLLRQKLREVGLVHRGAGWQQKIGQWDGRHVAVDVLEDGLDTGSCSCISLFLTSTTRQTAQM